MPGKTCTKCKKLLPLSKFYKNCKSKSGLASCCKVCSEAARKRYRQSERGKETLKKQPSNQRMVLRARHIKRTYGITLEEYDQMFGQQNGVCAICHKPETIKNQWGLVRLAVDHDHITKKIRGLLCRSCNVMIGIARDNISILFEAAIYLEKNK